MAHPTRYTLRSAAASRRCWQHSCCCCAATAAAGNQRFRAHSQELRSGTAAACPSQADPGARPPTKVDADIALSHQPLRSNAVPGRALTGGGSPLGQSATPCQSPMKIWAANYDTRTSRQQPARQAGCWGRLAAPTS